MSLLDHMKPGDRANFDQVRAMLSEFAETLVTLATEGRVTAARQLMDEAEGWDDFDVALAWVDHLSQLCASYTVWKITMSGGKLVEPGEPEAAAMFQAGVNVSWEQFKRKMGRIFDSQPPNTDESDGSVG